MFQLVSEGEGEVGEYHLLASWVEGEGWRGRGREEGGDRSPQVHWTTVWRQLSRQSRRLLLTDTQGSFFNTLK